MEDRPIDSRHHVDALAGNSGLDLLRRQSFSMKAVPDDRELFVFNTVNLKDRFRQIAIDECQGHERSFVMKGLFP